MTNRFRLDPSDPDKRLNSPLADGAKHMRQLLKDLQQP